MNIRPHSNASKRYLSFISANNSHGTNFGLSISVSEKFEAYENRNCIQHWTLYNQHSGRCTFRSSSKTSGYTLDESNPTYRLGIWRKSFIPTGILSLLGA